LDERQALQPPKYTSDEARLAALELHGILDTPAEAGFDDVVRLAALICEAPVALVSFVASDRQWFKARVGFDRAETDLDSSVCAHALVEPDLLVIPDLSLDPRSRDNPLVTGEPNIRFYAGAPLRTADGHVLGSLCVIDTMPRAAGLTGKQADMLRMLARQVMAQLELRRAVVERDHALAERHSQETRRKASDDQFHTLFEAIEDGFCIIEMKFEGARAVDYRFIEVNPAFAEQTGLVDAQGKWMRELAPDHEEHWFDLYGRVALIGEPIRFEQPASQLGGRWYHVHAFRVGEAQQRLVGILFNDVTERRAAELARERAEADQQMLNHELSHRMKNTFAMVQAIASQTLRGVADQGPVEAFTQRLHTLSTAHDVLLEHHWTAAELETVIRAALSPLAPPDRFDIDGPNVQLGARTTLTISLLLHELTMNALKYGALSNEAGRIALRWRIDEEGGEAKLSLLWRESGGPPAQPPTRKGFGSRLIGMGLAGTGGVELRYVPLGLEAEFVAPLHQMQL
jgi:two-component sensor histidine kinase